MLPPGATHGKVHAFPSPLCLLVPTGMSDHLQLHAGGCVVMSSVWVCLLCAYVSNIDRIMLWMWGGSLIAVFYIDCTAWR